MGFVSPATDYVERRLCPETICNVGIDTRFLETSSGFAVIEPVTRLVQGQVLLIFVDGRTQFAKLRGRALITDDGEEIDGEDAKEVEIMGLVMYFISSADGKEL